MNWVIVGHGAMGLLWHQHLQKNLKIKQLSILSSTDKATSDGTYQYTTFNGQTSTNHFCYANTEQIQQADVIILCVKSYQVINVINHISPFLTDKCAIILAHNGIGTFEELPLPVQQEHTIYALLTTHGCLRTSPFSITHTGNGSSQLGLLSSTNNESHKELNIQITQILNKALPPVSFEKNIEEKQWLKLAVNCIINPLTAIHNIDNGLINNKEYQATINKLLKEIVTVAESNNIALQQSNLKGLVGEVANATAKNSSSMRCDILANQKTEIDYINGYIHRLGEKFSIATPENTRLWQTITNLEKTPVTNDDKL